jgi:hypothetical protein
MDETCPEWPCACADALILWKLAVSHWSLTPQADLDSVWHKWYTLGMPIHTRFICKWCRRQITGCNPNCPEKHRVEEVECCAVCANNKKQKQEPEPAQ